MLLKNKKATSTMISYVILIAIIIVMSIVLYSGIRTYIPRDSLKCPLETSIIITDSYFNSLTSELNLTLKNSGNFNLAGYFVQITNDSFQELAIIDISSYLNESYDAKVLGNSVLFSIEGGNSLSPNEEITTIFNLPSELGTPYSIKITPFRYQEENNRERIVSCDKSRAVKDINSLNQTQSCIPDLNVCLNKQCGIWTNGTCGNISCGICSSGYSCNATGQCMANQPIILLEDNFEGYSSISGLNLYAEMAEKGWEIIDNTHPLLDDDIYLQSSSRSYDGYYVVIQDYSEIRNIIDTTGYNNITLEYARRTYSLPTSNRMRIYWRIGTGSWTHLESINTNSWAVRSWSLNGGENQNSIQIRFLGEGDNDDWSYLDEVIVRGTPI